MELKLQQAWHQTSISNCQQNLNVDCPTLPSRSRWCADDGRRSTQTANSPPEIRQPARQRFVSRGSGEIREDNKDNIPSNTCRDLSHEEYKRGYLTSVTFNGHSTHF